MRRLLSEPYPARSAMALIKAEVTQEVVDYLARHARQDEVLERVARETAEMPNAVMATTPDEAALLTMLARLIGARPALESLRAMPAEPSFDYVFLDADKTGYPDYYDELVPRLLPGGLLLIDNVLLSGGVTDPQDDRERIMDALNERVTADDRVDSVMALVADGLTFVRRR